MSRMAEETPLPGQFQTHWLAQRWRAVACVTWCVSPNIAKLKLITNAPHMKRPGELWSPELRTFWKLSGWLNPSQGWVRVDFGYHAKLEIWGEPLIWMFKRELPKNARCSPRICHIAGLKKSVPDRYYCMKYYEVHTMNHMAGVKGDVAHSWINKRSEVIWSIQPLTSIAKYAVHIVNKGTLIGWWSVPIYVYLRRSHPILLDNENIWSRNQFILSE